MWRIVVSQIRARPGRAVALLTGIVVATASFTVLTGASRTGRLDVRGTVAEHFRTSYDILVRPPGARTALERSDGLVRAGGVAGAAAGWALALALNGSAGGAVVVTAACAAIGALGLAALASLVPAGLAARHSVTTELAGD